MDINVVGSSVESYETFLPHKYAAAFVYSFNSFRHTTVFERSHALIMAGNAILLLHLHKLQVMQN